MAAASPEESPDSATTTSESSKVTSWESDARIRGLVDHSVAGVAEVDLAGRFRFVNARYAEIVGRSRETLLGLRMQDITHPDDLIANLPLFERISQDGQSFAIEKRYIRPDGAFVWVNNSVSAVRSGSGEVAAIIAVTVDITEGKQAEAARLEGEERLGAIIDNLPQGAVYRAAPDSQTGAVRFTFLSAGVESIFGVSADEGLADPMALYGAILEDDRASMLALEREAVAKRTSFDSEFRIRHRNGEVRWLHVRSAPRDLPDGRTVWEGLLLDITERKQTADRLREQENQLRLALEAGRMGTWTWDIEAERVRWSPQVEAIHGLAPGTFPGTFEAYQNDIHPDDRALVLSSVERAIRDNQRHHVEYRLIWPDGSLHWVEARGKLFRDQAGRPRSMIGVCMDVTERKRREEDLQLLSEASRLLTELVTPTSMLQAIADLTVSRCSDACVVYVRHETGRVDRVARAYAGVLSENPLSAWDASDRGIPKSIATVFRTGQSLRIESVDQSWLREDTANPGRTDALTGRSPYSFLAVPLVIRGQTIGVIAWLTSQLRRTYSAPDSVIAEELGQRIAIAWENGRLYSTLQDEARRKDEFLALLAHELRNPLAPIRTGLEVLRMVKADPDRIESVRAVMERQTHQLIALVDDLLDLSRITRGKLELRRQTTDLSLAIQTAIESAEPTIREADHTLTVDLEPRSIRLDADPNRLAQIVANLLINAAKYTSPGGTIRLTTRFERGTAVVAVADTGIGIPVPMQRRIFEMFAQLDRPADRAITGLGIGLTLVKTLVELHGGTVTVESEENRGSTFEVRLPGATRGDVEPISEPTNGSSPGGTPVDEEAASKNVVAKTDRRILVVDDNRAAADLLALTVRLAGYLVQMAHDGQEAVETAERFRPDLIFMDLGMPRMDGYETARRIRQTSWGRTIRLVALTGWGQADDRLRTESAGFDHHLVKPAEPDTIRELLHGLSAST